MDPALELVVVMVFEFYFLITPAIRNNPYLRLESETAHNR
jgi:hypothetical protein